MALQIPHHNGILKHTPLENTCSRGISSPLQPPFKQHQRHYKAVGCSWSTWEPYMNIYIYIILLCRYDICILYPIIGHMWLVVVMFFKPSTAWFSWQIFLSQAASAERERRARKTQVAIEWSSGHFNGWFDRKFRRVSSLKPPWMGLLLDVRMFENVIHALFSGYWIEASI